MKFMEKFKDRYNILTIVLVIVMLALSFRLATLTVAQGDYYRNIADNKRLKEIYVTAPRGEIRDRNGEILAENKSSFTVQILKDEFKGIDTERKNEILLQLSRLLEEDGVIYVDDFPIELNVFKYSNEEAYSEENILPMDKVVNTIVDNNLLPAIVDTYYIHPDYEEHYQFITVNKAVHALEHKGIEIPVEAKLDANGVQLVFDEKVDIEAWKKNHGISPNFTAKQSLLTLINNDKTVIRKIIDHSIARELTYNILKQHNLDQNLILEEYSLSSDEEYLQQKRDLMKNFKGISEDSKAKDDFIEIVTATSLQDLLAKVVEVENDKGKMEQIIPGRILIEKIEEKGLESPVEFDISEEEDMVLYSYKDGAGKDKEDPIDSLIDLAKDEGLLDEFITDENIKGIAQETMLANGTNPKISISKWEYISLVNKGDWLERFKISDKKNGEEIFTDLKKHFKLEDKLSKYEARAIMSLYDQLDKQGHRAYQPINIAYGIKDVTVARVEEGMVDTPAIQISVEPVRHYPHGETAAHILGYLGKISQPNEIDKYVKEKKYSPNDLIGKTGVEEKFESELRGENGIKRVEVDVLGNTTNVIDEEKAVPGNNLYLSMDLKLQKTAEDALKRALEGIQKGGSFQSKWGNYKFGTNRKKGRPYINATSGAVVVEDVRTGEILALANYPAYDPNLFSTGISSTDWESLMPEHEDDLLAPRPLYNVALQTAVQPGSTFKTITALAGLEQGFSPNRTIRDMGYVSVGNNVKGCWIWNSNRGTHGNENVYGALRDSCNYYFYSLALGRNQRTGESLGMRVDIDDIVNISKEFGLDDKTGIEIDIPREASGGVPNPENKILTTKSMLKRRLEGGLEDCIQEGKQFTQEEMEEKIDEIISWIDGPELLSRNQVLGRLEEMGLDPYIPLPGTKAVNGVIPGVGDTIKYTYLDHAGWSITDTLDVTIGQGSNSYTPIQMTNFIATLANGGQRHKVTIVDNIKNFDNSKTIYEREVNASKIKLNNYDNLDHVNLGMRKVATEGTARSIFGNFPVPVAVKTGTAERTGVNPATGDTYDDYAWFVAFAPYEEPEIAISVVLFQGGSGGYAGPVAREIIAEYMGLNKEEAKEEKTPYRTELAR